VVAGKDNHIDIHHMKVDILDKEVAVDIDTGCSTFLPSEAGRTTLQQGSTTTAREELLASRSEAYFCFF